MEPILRKHTGARGETNIEVFFDLVYAFAITQLSHFLLNHATVEGALQTVLLLAMCGSDGRTRCGSPTGWILDACQCDSCSSA